jgi:glycosyltransferase involved in cell wall biosynthesis
VKILHVIPSFYPAHRYGGPIESVYDLCRHTAAQGHQVRVLTTTADGPGPVLYPSTTVRTLPGGIEVTYCRLLAADSVSATLIRALPRLVGWADVVHLTAVYSFPTIPVLIAARAAGKPVVWSPRGSLQRWSGSTNVTLKKWWDRTCRLVSPRRVVLHVTSEEEACESAKAYPHTPFAVIPNGVSIPERLNRQEGDGTLRLLFLGRLHPKKGIENLLAACSRLDSAAGAPWQWRLTIAGVGDAGYTASLQSRIHELGLADRVRMIGHVSGPSKLQVFEQSDLLVTPSFTENFGMVIAEALAHEVPVIASRNTPWKSLDEERCGLWVDNDPATLVESILQLRKCALRDMGRRGRAWMIRDFGWEWRAREMLDVYSNAICSAERGREDEAADRSVTGARP